MTFPSSTGHIDIWRFGIKLIVDAEEEKFLSATYYYTLRFRMKLFLDTQELEGIVDAQELEGIVDKTILNRRALVASAWGVGSILDWKTFNKIALSFTVNKLDNSRVHHIRASTTGAKPSTRAIRYFIGSARRRHQDVAD